MEQQWPADLAKNAGSESSTGQHSPTPALVDCLTRLAEAMRAQTAAITMLAESNQALIQAMGQSEEADSDQMPTHYMNGRRI